MDINLSGKTVLVTGAAKGIGRAIALAFAEAGANVAVNDLSKADDLDELLMAIREFGVEAGVFLADVSKAEDVEAMVEGVIATIGPVDVLVNNAGISRVRPFLEVSEEEWDQVINTNLKSVFHCSQKILPGMLERGSGCIINIASELAYLGRAEFAPYTASKGGIITLTRSLAREFAPAIRINAIAPGPCETDMLRAEIQTEEQLQAEMDLPMQRLAIPEDIAGTAVFLASDYAAYYCGDVLSPNGGSLMR